MPKISIITTTYKHEKFISQTIESILNQTFTDWELLIWDDSANNETWNIVQKYMNNFPDKIKAWHNSPNKWLVDNMNFLISQSSSESKYIAFLEWDDLYTMDNLEKKLKVFQTYPEVAMVYNNLDFIDWDWKIIDKNFLKNAPFYLKNEKLTKEQFIKYDILYWSFSTLMFKKDILLKEKIINSTSDKLYSVSDWDLFFRISTKYNCYWIEDSMTLYRRHNGNLTLNNERIVNDFIIYLENFMDIEKTSSYYYKLYNFKTYINYLNFNRFKTIYFWIISFKYSFKNNYIQRLGMIFLSFLPRNVNIYIYNKNKHKYF